MRARYAWIVLCISLTSYPATAQEEDDLPPLELLGFIADFSDDEEGWTDPETIEDLFSTDESGSQTGDEGAEDEVTGAAGEEGSASEVRAERDDTAQQVQ